MARISCNTAQLPPAKTLHPAYGPGMATAPAPHDDGVDAFTAVELLRAALDGAGIVLPSLAVDPATPSLALVDLGRVRADVALRLAHALQGREAAA